MIKHTGAILAFIIFLCAFYSCLVPDSAIEPRTPRFPRSESQGPSPRGSVTVTRAGVFFPLTESLSAFQFQSANDNLWKSQN